MENFNAWIGKKEITTDFTYLRPVAMMQALLNQENKEPQILPNLHHWFYFLPVVNGQELAEDGHPRKGSFLPPIPFPKRMWAGGRLQFLNSIQMNKNIRRESEILNIEFKNGKSGNMYFVTVRHSIYAEDTLAIIEEHDIVYREATNQIQSQATSQNIQVKTEPKPFTYKKLFPVDTVTLFRYSAITFNGHKIHYDRTYATQVEGYPGLIVHGPLLATLLLHTFEQENPNKKVSNFEFRAINPIFDFNEFSICGDIHSNTGDLWIEKSDGLIAMKASITFEGE